VDEPRGPMVEAESLPKVRRPPEVGLVAGLRLLVGAEQIRAREREQDSELLVPSNGGGGIGGAEMLAYRLRLCRH
jgi:hypothetical protein